MLKGIAWMLGVLLVAGGCWWLYNRANGREVPINGDVFVRSAPPDSKETTDAAPQSDDAGNPSRDQTPAAPAAAPAAQAATPAPAETTAPAQTAAPQSASIAKPTAALPVADTVAPNPPNGMAFTGSGKYQWYRQGNLTWRVDTQSGTSCIAFATDEEWRKPRVLSHGCGNA
jgi:hypothetical protein